MQDVGRRNRLTWVTFDRARRRARRAVGRIAVTTQGARSESS